MKTDECNFSPDVGHCRRVRRIFLIQFNRAHGTLTPRALLARWVLVSIYLQPGANEALLALALAVEWAMQYTERP